MADGANSYRAQGGRNGPCTALTYLICTKKFAEFDECAAE